MAEDVSHRCPQCRIRLKKFGDDPDGGRIFYLCPRDGHRLTYHEQTSAATPEWPAEVVAHAVRQGVLTTDGRLLNASW